MPRYQVPFGASFDPDVEPEAGSPFEPGALLAEIAHRVATGDEMDRGHKRPLDTPWGKLLAEYRGEGAFVVETPKAELVVPRTMVAVATRALGITQATVEASGLAIQVLDVGRRILVVPLAERADVEGAPDEADLDQVPGADVDAAVFYTRTQRTPYVKLLVKPIGTAEPMTAVAACAMHHLIGLGVRATYPRTRVVGQVVGNEDAKCEVSVQAQQGGHGPKVEHLFVGGKVSPA